MTRKIKACLRSGILSLLLITLLAQPLALSAAGQKTSFSDIDGWYRDAIEYNLALGLVEGSGGDLFHPNAPMTQAMLVRFLGRLAFRYGGSLAYDNNTYVHGDVDKLSWYARYVYWAAYNHLIPSEEYPFSPNKPVTREAFAVYLCRCLDFLRLTVSGKPPQEPFFADSWTGALLPYMDGPPDYKDISSWTSQCFCQLFARRVMNGHPDGTWRPKEVITRAQACVVLMRIVERYK